MTIERVILDNQRLILTALYTLLAQRNPDHTELARVLAERVDQLEKDFPR